MEDGKITKQILKTRSGEFDLESIHTLNLRDLGVTDLGCIGECTGLERLNLSRNDITKLTKLAGLVNLTYLNLSANRISSLEGLQALDNLQTLNLAGNLIGSVDNLRCLTGLDKLQDLRLCDHVQGLSNPMCMNSNYKSDVTIIFPNLKTLDGERLIGRGSEVFRMFEEIDKALTKKSAYYSEGDISPAGPWVSEDYWKPSNTFEQSSLADADQQLDALLASCKSSCQKAEESLASAKSGSLQT